MLRFFVLVLLPSLAATFSRGPTRLTSLQAYTTQQLRGSTSTSTSTSSTSSDGGVGASDEDEIRQLYEKAQKEDAEWLRRVFDGSVFPLPVTTGDAPAPPTATIAPPTAPPAETEATTALFALGYSLADIADIKDSVLEVIVNKAVNRPRKGLPDSWLKRVDGAPPPRLQPSSSSPPSPLRSTKAPPTDEVGEAFAWAGAAPTDGEVSRGRRLREASIRARQGDTDADEEDNREDWGYDRGSDMDGPSPFWPDADEFKNMLIDESQWRVGIVGGWSKPFIKAETKWRYSLYKSWLRFLQRRGER